MPKKGYKHPEEYKRKMSEIMKGKNIWMKGKHPTEETRKKLSEIRKGEKNNFYGKHHTDEVKRKLSLLRSKNLRDNAPNWRGGVSFEPYSVDWTNTLKKSIRERDHYTCQVCFNIGNCVHHVDYDKQNCNPNNLITLCERCHNKTGTNRKKWMEYFNKKEDNNGI